MINENIQFRNVESTGGASVQVPNDVYQVTLSDVEVKNTETYNSKQGKTTGKEYEDVLSFKWTITEDPFKGQVLYTNFIPTAFYISPKTGKNKLFKIVEALLAKTLSREDIEAFTAQSLNALMGKSCRVMVENVTKGDKTFSNIVNWLPNKGAAVAAPEVDVDMIF